MTMTTVHGGQGEMSSTHAVRLVGWGCGTVGWGWGAIMQRADKEEGKDHA